MKAVETRLSAKAEANATAAAVWVQALKGDMGQLVNNVVACETGVQAAREHTASAEVTAVGAANAALRAVESQLVEVRAAQTAQLAAVRELRTDLADSRAQQQLPAEDTGRGADGRHATAAGRCGPRGVEVEAKAKDYIIATCVHVMAMGRLLCTSDWVCFQ